MNTRTLFVALVAAACSVEDTVGTIVAASDGGGSDAAGPGFMDAGGGGACSAPSVLPWDEEAAPFALCACGDVTSSGWVQVSASTGISGNAFFEAPVELGGGLWVTGNLGGATGAELRASELYVQASLRSDADVISSRFVGVGREIQAPRVVAPRGLSLPEGERLAVNEIVGPVRRAPLPAFQGCRCPAEAEDPLDGRGAVAMNLAGEVSLPCGVSRQGELTLQRPSTWTVSGSSQLVIEGDANLDASLTVIIQPGARLDLVVLGNLVSAGRLRLGDSAGPVNLRVNGTGTLQLSGETVVSGNLDAPRARLVASDRLEVGGRLRAGSLAVAADLLVTGSDARPDAGVPCSQDFECLAPAVCEGATCGR